MLRLSLFVAAFGLAFGLARPVCAQEVVPFAHVSYTEGRVLVEHEDTTDEVDGNTPLIAGDRVRTEDGRAEVLFGDGSLLQLDQRTTLDVLSDTLVRVMSGRIILRASSARGGAFQVDTPAGSVFVQSGGEYHIGLPSTEGRPTLDLAVVRGRADLASDVERLTVDAGQRAWARPGEAPSYPVAFNSAQLDAFADWAADRLDARRGTASYQYVAAPLRPYAGVLDTYGAWGYEAPYGYVWYPRVEVGWRPYYHGRWRFYASIGWTWIGGGAWAWPTHHYGRWGFSGARWFWIPGSTWGAGYVHWAVAPGYVSWCPLGYNNRPIFAFYGHGRSYAYGRHGYDGWRGWTVVPRRHFGAYASVSRVAVDGRALFRHASTPRFVERAPEPRAARAFRRADAGPGTRNIGGTVPRGAALDRSPRSGSRVFSSGAVDRRGQDIAGPVGRSSRGVPDTRGTRARSAPPRDGGYLSAGNGSRVYRVPRAESRTTRQQGSPVAPGASFERSNADGGGGSRTAPGARDRRAYATPRAETDRAPFTDQRGGRSTSTGRTAPPQRGSYAAPRDRNVPRSSAPRGGAETSRVPSFRDRGAGAARGTLAPSRDIPTRARPSREYAAPAPRATPRSGAIGNESGRTSRGSYRAGPERGTARGIEQAAPRGSGRSYGARPQGGSRSGGGMRQAPSSGGRQGHGARAATPRGGRHR